MRERRPQQLNPYVYDKMLYKRQMKSNPDAIVKFASPRRRNDSRGAAENGEDRDVDQAETQDWALGMDLDDEEDESWVERRRRRRSRSKNGEADADTGDAGLYPELESSDDNQPEMKKLLREAKKAKERALTREREEAKERARREKVEREAEKRRRSKPFPVDKEQARARAKRAEEPDNEDISAGERRSQSPVGEYNSVAWMMLILSSRSLPCLRTSDSDLMFQPHLEPPHRRNHRQNRQPSLSSPPPCAGDLLLATMIPFTMILETLTKATWATWRVAWIILSIPQGTLRE